MQRMIFKISSFLAFSVQKTRNVSHDPMRQGPSLRSNSTASEKIEELKVLVLLLQYELKQF